MKWTSPLLILQKSAQLAKPGLALVTPSPELAMSGSESGKPGPDLAKLLPESSLENTEMERNGQKAGISLGN